MCFGEVRAPWCVVRGAWCVVRGAWCVVRAPEVHSVSIGLRLRWDLLLLDRLTSYWCS